MRRGLCASILVVDINRPSVNSSIVQYRSWRGWLSLTSFLSSCSATIDHTTQHLTLTWTVGLMEWMGMCAVWDGIVWVIRSGWEVHQRQYRGCYLAGLHGTRLVLTALRCCICTRNYLRFEDLLNKLRFNCSAHLSGKRDCMITGNWTGRLAWPPKAISRPASGKDGWLGIWVEIGLDWMWMDGLDGCGDVM